MKCWQAEVLFLQEQHLYSIHSGGERTESGVNIEITHISIQTLDFKLIVQEIGCAVSSAIS